MLNIDLGNTRGIMRKLDDSGRLIMPSEFRRELNLNEFDWMEIFLLENGLYIRKKRFMHEEIEDGK